MVLKAIYDKKEDIPEQYLELFTEKDGKWELTGIEGIKTTADTERLSTSLTKERTDHKETKAKLGAFGELDPADAQTNADKIGELETKLETAEAAAGDGKPDEEQVEKLVEARVATQVKPLQREVDKLTKTVGEQADAITAFELTNTTRTVSDAVRKAAVDAKVINAAMEDALMLGEKVFEIVEGGEVLTRDNVGVTPGIDPKVWLTEMQEKRPHWWPVSQGGGAGGDGGAGNLLGGKGDNPFSFKHWNLTLQGTAVKANPEAAARLAVSAGTTVGGPKPTDPSAKTA